MDPWAMAITTGEDKSLLTVFPKVTANTKSSIYAGSYCLKPTTPITSVNRGFEHWQSNIKKNH